MKTNNVTPSYFQDFKLNIESKTVNINKEIRK
jgi:hypothetical protein